MLLCITAITACHWPSLKSAWSLLFFLWHVCFHLGYLTIKSLLIYDFLKFLLLLLCFLPCSFTLLHYIFIQMHIVIAVDPSLKSPTHLSWSCPSWVHITWMLLLSWLSLYMLFIHTMNLCWYLQLWQIFNFHLSDSACWSILVAHMSTVDGSVFLECTWLVTDLSLAGCQYFKSAWFYIIFLCEFAATYATKNPASCKWRKPLGTDNGMYIKNVTNVCPIIHPVLKYKSAPFLSLQFTPMEGFHVSDQLPFMEKLAKRYRTSVLHHLLTSPTSTTWCVHPNKTELALWYLYILHELLMQCLCKHVSGSVHRTPGRKI